MLALAGELATAYGITTWPEGEATKAAAVGFDAWLSLRGEVSGNAEQDQITQAVLDFIDRHGESRFSDATGPFDDRQQSMVRDRAGWWQSAGDGMEYWFTPGGMREALRGFDFDRGLKVLRLVGLLDAPATGKASKSKRIHGRFARVYVVRPDHAVEA